MRACGCFLPLVSGDKPLAAAGKNKKIIIINRGGGGNPPENKTNSLGSDANLWWCIN